MSHLWPTAFRLDADTKESNDWMIEFGFWTFIDQGCKIILYSLALQD